MHAKCSASTHHGKCSSERDGLLPWQPAMLAPSSTQLAKSSPPPHCNKVYCWFVTFYRKPVTWLTVLTPSTVLSPSAHHCYLLTPECDDVINCKASLEMFEVRLHCPVLRTPPPSKSHHASWVIGIPATWRWGRPSLCPSETFWSRECRKSPSRSCVSLQPPCCLPPVSSLLCTAGNMTPSPSARLSAHKPVTECVLPPWKKYFNKICSWSIKPSSRKIWALLFVVTVVLQSILSCVPSCDKWVYRMGYQRQVRERWAHNEWIIAIWISCTFSKHLLNSDVIPADTTAQG